MKFGAVSYLNMLPFFYSKKDFFLASSPKELNTKAQAGDINFACMSAIAGIRGGFNPVFPFLGIGSENKVRSVYLEILQTDFEGLDFSVFWADFLSANSGSYTGFSSENKPQNKGQVHVFTAGASEHSEWLVIILLWTQGFQAVIHHLDLKFITESRTELKAKLSPFCRGEPAALLVIGDPALARARLFPLEEKFRLDIATLWNSFSGLPCVFAVWFDARTAHKPLTLNTELVQFEMPYAALLRDNAASWNSQSEFARWCAVFEFLNLHSPFLLSAYSHLNIQVLRHDVLEYLSHIKFEFDARYRLTYEAYCKLNSEFLKDSLNFLSGGRPTLPAAYRPFA